MSRKFLAQTERNKNRACNALEVPSLQIYFRDALVRKLPGKHPVNRDHTNSHSLFPFSSRGQLGLYCSAEVSTTQVERET